MSKLPLAMDIADAVSTADVPLDVEAKADELLEAHPEADASREEIRDVLAAESETGLPGISATEER